MGCYLYLMQVDAAKKGQPLPLDRFVEAFESFCQTASLSLDTLQAQQEASEKNFLDMLAFFGEDPSKCTSEEFFGLMSSFVAEFLRVSCQQQKEEGLVRWRRYALMMCYDYEQARQEVEKKRLMEEKAAKRKQAQEAAVDKKGGAENGGEDLVDDILGTSYSKSRH